MQDEVLAAWSASGETLKLEVYCHGSGGIVVGERAGVIRYFKDICSRSLKLSAMVIASCFFKTPVWIKHRLSFILRPDRRGLTGKKHGGSAKIIELKQLKS
jgi:hypothetical protein